MFGSNFANPVLPFYQVPLSVSVFVQLCCMFGLVSVPSELCRHGTMLLTPKINSSSPQGSMEPGKEATASSAWHMSRFMEKGLALLLLFELFGSHFVTILLVPLHYIFTSHYKTVNFLKITYKRHLIGHPWGRAMRCLLWVQSMIYGPAYIITLLYRGFCHD